MSSLSNFTPQQNHVFEFPSMNDSRHPSCQKNTLVVNEVYRDGNDTFVYLDNDVFLKKNVEQIPILDSIDHYQSNIPLDSSQPRATNVDSKNEETNLNNIFLQLLKHNLANKINHELNLLNNEQSHTDYNEPIRNSVAVNTIDTSYNDINVSLTAQASNGVSYDRIFLSNNESLLTDQANSVDVGSQSENFYRQKFNELVSTLSEVDKKMSTDGYLDKCTSIRNQDLFCFGDTHTTNMSGSQSNQLQVAIADALNQRYGLNKHQQFSVSTIPIIAQNQQNEIDPQLVPIMFCSDQTRTNNSYAVYDYPQNQFILNTDSVSTIGGNYGEFSILNPTVDTSSYSFQQPNLQSQNLVQQVIIPVSTSNHSILPLYNTGNTFVPVILQNHHRSEVLSEYSLLSNSNDNAPTSSNQLNEVIF